MTENMEEVGQEFIATYDVNAEINIKQEPCTFGDVKVDIDMYNLEPESFRTVRSEHISPQDTVSDHGKQMTIKVEVSESNEDHKVYNVTKLEKCDVSIKLENDELQNMTRNLQEEQDTFPTEEEELGPKEDTNVSIENVPFCYCKFCDFKTNYQHVLMRHFKMNHDEWHQCQFCEYKARNKAHLTQHSKVKHSTQTSFDYCEMCKFKTIGKANLLRHMKNRHNVGVKWRHCQLCEYKTKFKADLDKHSTTHDKEAKEHSCNLCNYKSIHLRDFKRHFKSMHDDKIKLHQCQFCDFKTKYMYGLNSHLKIKHDYESTMYSCDVCDYKTKVKRYLQRHFKIFHDESAEWYQCNLCSYKTKQRYCLNNHSVKHTQQVQWYYCEFCDYKTKYKSALPKHNLKHNQNVEWYSCKVESCHFKTKYERTIKWHVKYKHDKIFDWLNCGLCEYKTIHKSSLIKHKQRMHNPDRKRNNSMRNSTSNRKTSQNIVYSVLPATALNLGYVLLLNNPPANFTQGVEQPNS